MWLCPMIVDVDNDGPTGDWRRFHSPHGLRWSSRSRLAFVVATCLCFYTHYDLNSPNRPLRHLRSTSNCTRLKKLNTRKLFSILPLPKQVVKNFDERPHRRIVSHRGGKWIRPTYDKWFVTSVGAVGGDAATRPRYCWLFPMPSSLAGMNSVAWLVLQGGL